MITKPEYIIFSLGMFVSGIFFGFLFIGLFLGKNILIFLGTIGIVILITTKLTVGKKLLSRINELDDEKWC